MTFRVKQLSNNEVEITVVPPQSQPEPEPVMLAGDYLQQPPRKSKEQVVA
jgi:hypothetical protein